MKTTLAIPHKKEKGQIIVILALVFIGLIAIIGLAIDLGYMYVSYARLTRAVDAAALGATTQFKKNVDTPELQSAAREFLVLNGVPNDKSLTALVETCKTNPTDTTLCFSPPRKLVRVTASENVPMFFLSIVGIPYVPIKVTSIAEAAAVDLVLLIDKSNSMHKYTDSTNSHEISPPSSTLDPEYCNDDTATNSTWQGDCHPFHEVKQAAYNFIDTFMDDEYDRIAIVVFDVQATAINFGTTATPVYLYGGKGNKTTILGAIKSLWMYDGFLQTGSIGGNPVDQRSPIVYQKSPACDFKAGDPSYPPTSPFNNCRLKDTSDRYINIICWGSYSTPKNYSQCGGTNMADALYNASSILESAGRDESLWVTILLTDGIANLAYDDRDPRLPICPVALRTQANPLCSDRDPTTRHPFVAGDPNSPYDVMDRTRDKADQLATEAKSIIFSIGLGGEVTDIAKYTDDISKGAQGVALLNYIAYKGQTGSYYPATPASLNDIFLKIANKIATRLTK